MKSAATTFLARLRRFARWFFNVSPEAVDDPPPTPTKPKSRSRNGRQRARLRASHAGRVHVSDRKPS